MLLYWPGRLKVQKHPYICVPGTCCVISDILTAYTGRRFQYIAASTLSVVGLGYWRSIYCQPSMLVLAESASSFDSTPEAYIVPVYVVESYGYVAQKPSHTYNGNLRHEEMRKRERVEKIIDEDFAHNGGVFFPGYQRRPFFPGDCEETWSHNAQKHASAGAPATAGGVQTGLTPW